MGASAFLKGVDFRAFAVNVKTIAPKKYLYQFGHAIWWYTAPRIINTFLESYVFSGRQIILFATSGGSGFGKTKDDLKVSISKQATIMEGGLLNGKQTKESLKSWVERL